MIKVDKTIKKETSYIIVVSGILSVLMQAVFLIINKWDYTVLLGNILSLCISVLNFFFMGITIQKALEMEEGDAKKLMRASQSIRNLLMFAILAVGVILPMFNTVALIVPLFFSRIAVFLRPLIKKDGKDVNKN